MVAFNIRVISDLTCPFCYLGKARLEKAIQKYQRERSDQTDTFNISWEAFVIDPTAPEHGVPVQDRMSKIHGAKKLEMIHQRVKDMGHAEGLNFTFEGKIGSTRDAHRVIQLAKTKGNLTENRVVQCIMQSYFEKGGDITSWQMLTKAGVEGGLLREEVEKWLTDGTGGDVVDEEAKISRTTTQGVPHFVIQEKFHASGALDSEALADLLVSAAKG